MEQHSDVYSSRCEGRRASGFHKLQRMYIISFFIAFLIDNIILINRICELKLLKEINTHQ